MNMMNSPSTRGKATRQMTCPCCSEIYKPKGRKRTKRYIRKLEEVMWRKDWNI